MTTTLVQTTTTPTVVDMNTTLTEITTTRAEMTITLSDTTTTLTQNKYNFGKDSNRNDYNFGRDYNIWARPSEVGPGRARFARTIAGTPSPHPQGKGRGWEGICGSRYFEIPSSADAAVAAAAAVAGCCC